MEFQYIDEMWCDYLSSTLWKLGLIDRHEHVRMLNISEQYVMHYFNPKKKTLV